MGAWCKSCCAVSLVFWFQNFIPVLVLSRKRKRLSFLGWKLKQKWSKNLRLPHHCIEGNPMHLSAEKSLAWECLAPHFLKPWLLTPLKNIKQHTVDQYETRGVSVWFDSCKAGWSIKANGVIFVNNSNCFSSKKHWTHLDHTRKIS